MGSVGADGYKKRSYLSLLGLWSVTFVMVEKKKSPGRRNIIFLLSDVMMTLVSINRSRKEVGAESKFKFPAWARQKACMRAGTTPPAGAHAKYLSCQPLLWAGLLGSHCGGVRQYVYIRVRG